MEGELGGRSAIGGKFEKFILDIMWHRLVRISPKWLDVTVLVVEVVA